MLKRLVGWIGLVAVLVVPSVAQTHHYATECRIKWNHGVDSVLISGADTIISDTFQVSGQPFKGFTVMTDQANDSAVIDSMFYEMSMATRYEVFRRVYNSVGDREYSAMHLVNGASTTTMFVTPDTISFALPCPDGYRVRIKVITSAKCGTNMKLRMTKFEVD